jgi:hypothetical protein
MSKSKMNEEKFKLVLSAPVDKNGMVIKLAISHEDSHTLHLRHYPEFTWYIVGLVGLLGVAGIFLFSEPSVLIYCAIVCAGLIYKIFNERAFTCTINKITGVINYHCSGVLMTTLDEQKVEHTISQIQQLEMQRYVKGGRWSGSWFGADTFQIFLLLDKEQRLSLSPANLNFSECQDLTQQIRDFLGNEIPVKAID